MKKLSILLLASTLFVSGVTTYGAELKISVNGNMLEDASPYMNDGTTMLPLRKVGEALNAKVDYATYKGHPKITLTKGEDMVIVGPTFMTLSKNNDIVTEELSKPLLSKDNTTYVALRDVAEALNITVDFNQSQNTVYLTEKAPTETEINDFKTVIERKYNAMGKEYALDAIENDRQFKDVNTQIKNILINYVEELEQGSIEEKQKEEKELQEAKKEQDRKEQAAQNKIAEAKKLVYVGNWEHWLTDHDYKEVYRYEIRNDSNLTVKKVKVTAGSYDDTFYTNIEPNDHDHFYLRKGDPLKLKVEALEFE